MQQRSLQQVRVSVSLIFLIHGLIIATWASRIPAFQAHLHLSPAVLGRSLMMAAIGSVLAMPAAGWLINKFGSLSIVIGSTLGFVLALPLIAESNTVLTLSVALLFYGAIVKTAPLPAGAQFLNVIESVFSGMARAIIHNSDYPSVEVAKDAIDRYFTERNERFSKHPKRAGQNIWEKERVPSKFTEGQNCKDPLYR
jgi:MFS family permease